MVSKTEVPQLHVLFALSVLGIASDVWLSVPRGY